MEREHVIPSLHWDSETVLSVCKQVCDMKDLPEPRLLRFSNAAVLTAGPEVIVRVDDMKRKVWVGKPLSDLVQILVDAGVMTPSSLQEISCEIRGDYCFTFYERVDDDDSLTESEKVVLLGEALAQMHKTPIGQLDAMNDGITIDHIAGMFERLDEANDTGFWKQTSLNESELTFLEHKVDDLFVQIYGATSWRDIEPVVLHGDAHLGNCIANSHKLYLIDFEYVSRGPAFLDHLHILLSDTVFRTNLYPLFVEGYGADLRSDMTTLEPWIQLVSIPYIVWTASVGLRSDSHRREAQRRIKWLAEGLTSDIIWETGF